MGSYHEATTDSMRIFPLIYSNLGLSITVEDNTAQSNSIYAGTNALGSQCATTLEFALLAAKSPIIKSFTISQPSSSNLNFLDKLGLAYWYNSNLTSSTECSTF